MKADGTTLWLHQSDIESFRNCPDQFRIVNGVLPGGDFEKVPELRLETDAATVGTCFHAMVEHDIGNGFTRLTDAQRWAKDFMTSLLSEYTMNGTEYRCETFGADPAKALTALAGLTKMWFNCAERKDWKDLSDQPGEIELEWKFDVPFLQNLTGRYTDVRLAGTADVLDRHGNRLIDWKTASRKYERWEKQRWAVQPTVYTYAAGVLGEIEPFAEGYRFDYRIFNRKYLNDPPQEVTVWRSQGQWSWLVEQVTRMVKMVESNLDEWPVRDDHALCGEKWCPVWAQCKGSYMEHPTWA